jgi:hypothetical protein
MQERIDVAEASGLGRAALARVAVTDGDMPLPVHTPAFEDHLHAEFYG